MHHVLGQHGGSAAEIIPIICERPSAGLAMISQLFIAKCSRQLLSLDVSARQNSTNHAVTTGRSPPSIWTSCLTPYSYSAHADFSHALPRHDSIWRIAYHLHTGTRENQPYSSPHILVAESPTQVPYTCLASTTKHLLGDTDPASAYLSFVFHTRPPKPRTPCWWGVMLTIYKGLVQPYKEYASHVYDVCACRGATITALLKKVVKCISPHHLTAYLLPVNIRPSAASLFVFCCYFHANCFS